MRRGRDRSSHPRRRQAHLRGRRHQRPAGHARCGGMSADVWCAFSAGAGGGCRGAAGANARRRGRGGFCGARRARLGGDKNYGQRRRCGTGRQRFDTLRGRRARPRPAPSRVHRGRDVESQVAAGAYRGGQHCSAGGSGSNRRVHADEGGDGAEDGTQHAFYCGDGAVRPRLRQLDDRRGPD